MPGFSDIRQQLSDKIKTTPPVRVIVVSFALIILVGTLLLMLPISSKVGELPSSTPFTTTSATCVTGLVVGIPTPCGRPSVKG